MSADVPDSGVVTAHTDAGMLAVWDAATFRDVDGYDAWERRVEDRLAEAIRAGELVPVNIGSDGAYGVRLVTSADGLTDRETIYEVVTSEPYLLVASGGDVCLGGLEFIGSPDGAPATLELPAGRYAVRTTIVGWDEEPGAKDADGRPSPTALPDFVVQIGPATGDEVFRTAEETFDPPR